MTRKTYGRLDIGRIELEGGWFPGESWAIEAHAGFSPSDQRLCLAYLQVAKLCFSITVDTGRRVSLEDAADWGEKFEAAAHRGPMPAPNGLPPAPEEEVEPTAEQIEAARYAVRGNVYTCEAPGSLCQHCHGLDNQATEGFCSDGSDRDRNGDKRRARARSWLEERGIPVEAAE